MANEDRLQNEEKIYELHTADDKSDCNQACMSKHTDRNGLDNSWDSVTPDAVGRAELAKAKIVTLIPMQ